MEQHRHEVGRLIEHTVSNWDPGETSKRLELAVGRDLQFVRINGTLVGGLVGLILYTASHLAGTAVDAAPGASRKPWLGAARRPRSPRSLPGDGPSAPNPAGASTNRVAGRAPTLSESSAAR